MKIGSITYTIDTSKIESAINKMNESIRSCQNQDLNNYIRININPNFKALDFESMKEEVEV